MFKIEIAVSAKRLRVRGLVLLLLVLRTSIADSGSIMAKIMAPQWEIHQ